MPSQIRVFPVPNSRIQARPLGLRTRAISAKEAERGAMLRMPKAMVRPSIHASGRGRARASAPTERTKSLSSPESFFCPCTSMGGQKSIASTCTAGWRLRTANVTSNVPAARSRTRFPSACPGSTASARHFRQPWSKPRLKSLFNGSYHLTIRAKSPETFAACASVAVPVFSSSSS